MTVDPKRLRELLVISRSGTITEAARQLNVSQPALSHSIRLMEEKLGVRLLDRDRKGATTTEYGKLLMGYAQALETLLSRAAEDISHRKSGHSGTLIIGVTPIAAGDIVPAAVARLTVEAPDLWVRIVEDLDDRLLDKLTTGEIDLIVGPIGISPHDPSIVETPLFEDEFHVILRPEHPLADRKSVRLNQLADAYWVMPEIGTASHRQMESLFAEAKLPWPARRPANEFGRRYQGDRFLHGLRLDHFASPGTERGRRGLPEMRQTYRRSVRANHRRQSVLQL